MKDVSIDNGSKCLETGCLTGLDKGEENTDHVNGDGNDEDTGHEEVCSGIKETDYVRDGRELNDSDCFSRNFY